MVYTRWVLLSFEYILKLVLLARLLAVVVCLSVRLYQVGTLLKRLNVGSHKQRHTIAEDSSFLVPKILAKLTGVICPAENSSNRN